MTEYDEYQRPVGITELQDDSIIITDRPRPRAVIGHKVTLAHFSVRKTFTSDYLRHSRHASFFISHWTADPRADAPILESCFVNVVQIIREKSLLRSAGGRLVSVIFFSIDPLRFLLVADARRSDTPTSECA